MKIVVGGTFDRFHAGHKAFLDKAFKSGEKIIIGLTTPSMLKKIVMQDSIWSFKKRKKVVEEFVKKYKKRFEVVPIHDIFGPSIEIEDLDAIVATEETRKTCERINILRKRKGLKPLKIIQIPYIYAEDCRKISSSRIRKGEIDREGKILIDYLVTEELKEELRKPAGIIFEGENKTVTQDLIHFIQEKEIEHIICVGDVVSFDFLNSSLKPTNIIIDGKVMRKPISYEEFLLSHYKKILYLKNPGGRIVKEAWKLMRDVLKEESAFFIKGEEDLLVIPTVLLAEKNSAVIYGQPGRGKVIIIVNEKKKEEVRELLKRFKTTLRV